MHLGSAFFHATHLPPGAHAPHHTTFAPHHIAAFTHACPSRPHTTRMPPASARPGWFGRLIVDLRPNSTGLPHSLRLHHTLPFTALPRAGVVGTTALPVPGSSPLRACLYWVGICSLPLSHPGLFHLYTVLPVWDNACFVLVWFVLGRRYFTCYSHTRRCPPCGWTC